MSTDGATLFVSGNSDGHLVTMAYDAVTGAGRWMARFDGLSALGATTSLGVSPDGTRIFVTGEISYANNAYAYATVAYDAATGGELWWANYSYPARGINNPHALAVSPDGTKVFVTGQSWAPDTDDDYATIAYEAATGAQLWVGRYDGPESGVDLAWALSVTPDGTRVLVSGYSSYDFATISYDAARRTEEWVARYDSGHTDWTYAMSMTPDGTKAFVTGTSNGNYGAVAYDVATGAELWVASYDGGTKGDQALASKSNPDGTEVFVTGASEGPSGYKDFATIAYDSATGAELWVARFDDAQHWNDTGRVVDVSPDGSTVYVSGDVNFTIDTSGIVTLAYDATTGMLRRFARLPTPEWGVPEAMTISGDGAALFFTGWISTPDTVYLTVAYDLTP